MPMIVSVILCTYNRAHSLGTALESVLESSRNSEIDWELLVVDNNSNDNTSEVIKTFCQRFPQIVRYLRETAQGLSNARNAGIKAARGEIIAFVDDDVTVEPGWLQNLTACLHDGQWAGAGGRILPPADFSPPAWLALQGPWNQGGALCAQFDFGDMPIELKEKGPYGTNMAFRREMFEKHGGFRVDLGRSGGSLIGNEDTEFGHRLMAAGERLRYEPSAIVYHSIIEKRLNKKYFWAWWFAFGRAQERQKGRRSSVYGIPRYFFSLPNILLRHLLPHAVRSFVARDPHERFSRQCNACSIAGSMAEIWNKVRTGRYSAQPRRAEHRTDGAFS